MNTTAVDLIVRLVAQRLSATPCSNCGKPLDRARITVREVTPDDIVVEAACAACKRSEMLQLKPEGDGAARVT